MKIAGADLAEFRSKRQFMMDKRPQDPADQDDLPASFRDTVLTTSIYLVIALLIYAASMLSWWIGVVLFAAFAAYVLLGLLVNGLVFMFLTWIVYVVARWIRVRGLNPAKFDEFSQGTGRVFSMSGIMIFNQMAQVAITLLLAGTLFFGWFS